MTQPLQDPVSGLLLALERKLEMLRQEYLAKNRAVLRNLDGGAQQRVELLTSCINEKILQEISGGLRRSASNGEGKRVLAVLSELLDLS